MVLQILIKMVISYSFDVLLYVFIGVDCLSLGVANFLRVLEWRLENAITDQEFSNLYKIWLSSTDSNSTVCNNLFHIM